MEVCTLDGRRPTVSLQVRRLAGLQNRPPLTDLVLGQHLYQRRRKKGRKPRIGSQGRGGTDGL